MLNLRGVTKRYGEMVAVDAVDLDCPGGKTQVLIGQSGCGKSTLLRMMVGLVAPDAGEIVFDGEPMREDTLQIRLRIGYMIQEGGLFPHLTVRHNVTLVPRYLGWKQARCNQRTDELLQLTRLPA